MGLKTLNFAIPILGITLPTAYSKIGKIEIDSFGNAKALFFIQQTREDVETLSPLLIKEINFAINKELPIYSQAYLKAKEVEFLNWEDDIV